MTPGIMIASVIILGQALQPVEMGINQARSLAEAIGAFRTVEAALEAAQSEQERMSLPPRPARLMLRTSPISRVAATGRSSSVFPLAWRPARAWHCRSVGGRQIDPGASVGWYRAADRRSHSP